MKTSNRVSRYPMRTYKPVVSNTGIVKVDGVPIGKVTQRGTLQVWDKNKHRARLRGSNVVEVDLCDLQALCNPVEGESQSDEVEQ